MKTLLNVDGSLILTAGCPPLLYLLRHLLHSYGCFTIVLGMGFLRHCPPLLLARNLLALVFREGRECPIDGRLLHGVKVQLPSCISLLLYEVKFILLSRERLIVGLHVWLLLGFRKVGVIGPHWLLFFL
jgi:hypothetical protein